LNDALEEEDSKLRKAAREALDHRAASVQGETRHERESAGRGIPSRAIGDLLFITKETQFAIDLFFLCDAATLKESREEM